MTAAARITLETVADVAEDIEARGDTASVRKVMAMLGGSPNTIAPLMKKWRESRPNFRAAQFVVDPRIASLMAEQVHSAVTEATRAADIRLAEVLDDAELIAEAGRAAEQLAAELASELEAARARIQQQAGQIEQMRADASLVKAEAAGRVKVAEDRAAAEIGKAEALLAREVDAREAAQKALIRAEFKLEALSKLEFDLDAARAEAKQARGDASAAERGLAVGSAELKALQGAFERLSAEVTEAKAATGDERRRADAAEREYGQAIAQVQTKQVALDAALQRVRDLEAR